MIIKDIEKRLEHRRRMSLAGDPMPRANGGAPVILWLRHRDGSETEEVLPQWVAELVLSDMHNEHNVERAKIVRRSPNLDCFLLSDLAQLMADREAMEAA